MKINPLIFKEIISKKNISQAELSRRLDVKPQNLSKYLKSGSFPVKHKDMLYNILGDDLRKAVLSEENFYIIEDNTKVNESSGEYGKGNINLIKEIRLLRSQVHALQDLVESKQKIIDLLEESLSK